MRGKEDPFLKIGQANDRAVKGDSDIVYSLRDINFEIQQGEAVGIIGKNGAGKSTLLKILSRVTSPTTGKIEIKGRIASLLEVGTGFHPELTGRENIYLNGAILGMRKKEITRKLDEIIDFSGVERYIDTPVKRYSSGMYVRLAFAVAAHLESEILIVDEVLAVGDAEFQKKCLGKMNDVSKSDGRTILFVSHNMSAVNSLCSKSLFLENGITKFSGETAHAIDLYLSNSNPSKKNIWKRTDSSNRKAFFSDLNVKITGKQPHLKLELYLKIIAIEKNIAAFIAIDIKNSRGTVIMQAIPEIVPFIYYSPGDYEYACTVELNGLIPDQYLVSFWVGQHNTITYDFVEDVLIFEIVEGPILGRTFPYHFEHGNVVPTSNLSKIN